MTDLSESIRTVQTNDGRIILDIPHGRLVSVNTTGARILDFLSHGWDELRIAAEISQESGTSIQVVLADVRSFIESLRNLQLIQDRS